MPRNISFSLTTAQVRAKTKTVTRRLGWRALKVGDVLNACVKCMGLKPGEKIERICQVRVTAVHFEHLCMLTGGLMGPGSWAAKEMKREGFPKMSPVEFVTFFCASHPGCTPSTLITRIEFEYLPRRQTPPCKRQLTIPRTPCGGGVLSR